MTDQTKTLTLREKLLVAIQEDKQWGGYIENFPEEFIKDKLLPIIQTHAAQVARNAYEHGTFQNVLMHLEKMQ